MGNRRAMLVGVLVVCYALVASTVGGYGEFDEGRGGREGEEWPGAGEGGSGRREGNPWFLLQESKHVVRTDAGDMRVVRGYGGKSMRNPMHVGFITMEPTSLFIPQYLDSSLILFIRRGEAVIGTIYKDDFVERRLRTGDIYRIPAGSAFYLVNTAEGQRLHIVCSIDTSESLGWGAFQSFYIGGGTHPTSILSGFDSMTMSTAFNVSESELRDFLTRQQSGAIIRLSDSRAPSVWKKFLDLEQHQRAAHMRKVVRFEEEAEQEGKQPTWSVRKFLMTVFGMENKGRDDRGKGKGEGPDSYNIYDRKPDFRNNYGWSTALDESDYAPLRNSGIGVYLVNLTAGSMMAPHVNPTATEYGIVLRGAGTIQIVYPNGTLAMNAKVSEGDVFWVPRYFPFCQIASRTGPFEFFGFTTSARENRPQFLVGANSLLQTMRGPEFATSFGVSEETLRRIIDAQRESVILPSPSVAPPDETLRAEEAVIKPEMIPQVIRSFGNDMVMGFD